METKGPKGVRTRIYINGFVRVMETGLNGKMLHNGPSFAKEKMAGCTFAAGSGKSTPSPLFLQKLETT